MSRIFKKRYVLFLASFLSCFSLFAMEENSQDLGSKALVHYKGSKEEEPFVRLSIARDFSINLRRTLLGHFFKPNLTLEYRLLIGPYLRKLEHDYNLEIFRTFLKTKGVILRSELDDRSVTKQGRIEKDDVMLLSSDSENFYWCNGTTKCIELRSTKTPEQTLRVFPIPLDENYKFLDLTHFDKTNLIIEVAKSFSKRKSYQESKVCILDTTTGAVKYITDKEFPFVDSLYGYKTRPDTLFVAFQKKGDPFQIKWQVYNLRDNTHSVVGEFSKHPGDLFFDREDHPFFSILIRPHGEQVISRVTEGSKWTVIPLFSFGKDMYDQRRVMGVSTTNGNIYFTAREKDIDRWTAIERTQKGPFSSEKPLFPDEIGDIKNFLVHTHIDGENVILYEVRNGGQKTLKCNTKSKAFTHLSQILDSVQREYSGEFSFVEIESIFENPKKQGLILSRRQAHRPIEYFIMAFSETLGKVTPSIFRPKTSLKFPLERFRDVQSVIIPTKEGLKMPAFITSPNPNVTFGKKPPLFVHIHGGPHAKDKLHDLDALSQLVASSGFCVLKINYPGSTGSGWAYEKMSDGKWDQTPGFIMQAIEWMIANKGIDPDRIAVGGISFGATMAVNMAARFPDSIKFAVACNGTYHYANTVFEAIGHNVSGKQVKSCHDPEDTIIQLGGDPRIPEQKELLRSKSVYPHLSKVRAPILLLAGLEDNNCIPSQSHDLAKVLSQAGKSVQLITFEGRGHSLENVKPQKGEGLQDYSFSAWNAVGAYTMEALHNRFGTLYEPVESNFYERMREQGIKIALSHNWN
ncbi:MAG: S9 family peptidase [Proteobacteria bacterium]|nr:S9 family peptidase [Pseudomonadota bacterium]